MKKSIKRFVLCLLVISLVVLCGCNQDLSAKEQEPDTEEASAQKNEKSPYKHGLDLIRLITEMAGNEAYITMSSPEQEIRNQAAVFAAGDRSDPLAVYALTWNEDAISKMIPSQWDSMSDTLREHAIGMAARAFITQINAASGQYAIAAASICRASKTFVNHSLTADVTYLYTYEDAVPVAVMFVVGEYGAVSASATFLSNDEFNFDSIEAIERFFTAEDDVSFVNVKKIR